MLDLNKIPYGRPPPCERHPMKFSRLPLYVWLFSLALFAFSVATSFPSLPERLATHFDAAGHPNGWSSRTAYVAFFPAFTLGVSGLVLGLTYSIRFFPSSTLNVPRSDYWRTPENYPRACVFIFRHTFWFAALMTLFMRYAHQSIATANLAAPPILNTGELNRSAGLFLAGLALWIFSLVHFFIKDVRSAN